MSSMSQFGVVGLGVMGENLSRNLMNKGYRVAVFDREAVRVKKFADEYAEKSFGANSFIEFCNALSRPRKILIMVPAGELVDQVIEQIAPCLETGDILIDGGNSHFDDTNRRCKELDRKGILFVGAGVSGGSEGALKGPSIMPGGAKAAWSQIREPLQAIAAKVSDGSSCCDWIGGGGSGHFVKMVHNGIEYGDMQIICEAYQILKDVLGCSNDEISGIFDDWNKGVLNSYLIEITADIFRKKTEDGLYVVDTILDAAGQKGTGKWTAMLALEQGMPVTLIAEAVFARCLSARKSERVKASERFRRSFSNEFSQGEKEEYISKIEQALYASKIISYAQGFSLLRAASDYYTWDIDYGTLAGLWRGGCIIRSAFLDNISEAFRKDPSLENLLLDDFFSNQLTLAESSWREVVAGGITSGVPLPAMSSALSYFDGYRTARLPANLLQAQRDYFGSHTYERIDRPRGEFFHTDW
jgi:6-phosphogluconate dehydrogenase